MTTSNINNKIKKESIKLMGADFESFTKVITRNDDLYLESEIKIIYKSTCEIGKKVEYKLFASFNKYENKITFIQA